MTWNMFSQQSLLDIFAPKGSALRNGDAWGSGVSAAPPTSTPPASTSSGWCGMTGGLGNDSAANTTKSGWCNMTGGLGSEKKDTWCGMTGGLGNKPDNNGGGWGW